MWMIASGNKAAIKFLKDSLSREFEMEDLGSDSKIFGLDITCDRNKGVLVL